MHQIRLLGMLAGAAVALSATRPASAQTDVKFALDWKFEGPSAPYFVALDKGYYKAEGLNVTIDTGPGSVAGIARVAAGTYPIGFFDINSLVKFQDQNPDKKVEAVLMVYDKPPFAIATTTKTGITKPKDLEGKILGAPARRRRLRAVEGVREGERHRRLQGQDREHRLPGARADARRRQGRRHHRLLVLDALQPAAEGPQAGGHQDHADGGPRPGALRQRHHGQSGLRQGQSRRWSPASCAPPSRACSTPSRTRTRPSSR